METAILSKRVWAYIINLILYLGIGFAVSVPFLTLLNIHVVLYVHISFAFAIVLSFIIDYFILIHTKGYTIGSAILGIKYVSKDGRKLGKRQSMIRSASESILVFVILDLFYFLRYRTERGVIDRLSDSFAIDTRI